MKHPFFFGYGSLVNRATHDFPQATPATLKGWRRVWRQLPTRPQAYLSVEQASGAEIEGLIAHVPDDDWAALDEREEAYARQVVTPIVDHALGDAVEIQVYAIPDGPAGPGSHPILLSYIDVVAQGFLHVYGEGGLERFFATTAGWNTPVVNDRSAPLYPRAQVLSAGERGLVDHWLSEVGAPISSG